MVEEIFGEIKSQFAYNPASGRTLGKNWGSNNDLSIYVPRPMRRGDLEVMLTVKFKRSLSIGRYKSSSPGAITTLSFTEGSSGAMENEGRSGCAFATSSGVRKSSIMNSSKKSSDSGVRGSGNSIYVPSSMISLS